MIEATVTNQLHPPVAGRPDMVWTLGADATGALVTDSYDTETPHLLIAGGSNSGKSTVMHSMLCQLMHNNTPDDLKVWILEPKNELHPYSGRRSRNPFRGRHERRRPAPQLR